MERAPLWSCGRMPAQQGISHENYGKGAEALSGVDRNYWLMRADQCRASATMRDEPVRRRLLAAAESYQMLADTLLPQIAATLPEPAEPASASSSEAPPAPDRQSAAPRLAESGRPLFKWWFADPRDRTAAGESDALTT